MGRRTIVLIDGENLLLRFQEMCREPENRTVRDDIRHEQDRYVWQPEIASHRAWDLVRVSYYTTHVGTAESMASLARDLAKIRYEFDRPSRLSDYGYVVPRVFKKPKKEQKTASVDINISIDMLRHTYTDAIDEVLLVTGDGDYLPLIEEVMRQGKIVYLAALSSGLHRSLPASVDEFIDLDSQFFI